MSEEVYRRLREFMDRLPGGFPATKSGVELKLLKKLFAPDEAEVVMKMGPFPMPLAQAAKAIGLEEKAAAEKLESMAKKGQLFRMRAGNTVLYMAMQFAVGVYEFSMNRMDKETAELLEEYMKEGALQKIFTQAKTQQLRVVPIQESLPVSPQVASYDQVRALVEKHQKFSVSPCICRKEQALLGHPCSRPLESCLQFGPAADYYVENGLGRSISKEEVFQILRKAEEAALVLSPTNAQEIGSICCCCSCCCGVIRNLSQFERPAEIVASGYRAVLSAEDCSNCGACLDRCQMAAIEEGDERVSILAHRCIGCGLCVPACPEEAIKLLPRPEAAVPPANIAATMMQIMKERGLL